MKNSEMMSEEFAKDYQILIVEDDPTHLHLITNCLKNDYRLLIAKTQSKAFDLLINNHIDAMLLDINLPDGSGFNICKEVKSNRSKYGDISIIFMTSEESSADEAYGLKIGANDYIRKPYDDEVLKARVGLQINLIRKTQLLAKLVKLDGLTEIPNRRAFDEQLFKEWYRAKRDKVPLSLAFIDIDCFKQFNDTYGHPTGDKCLISLAKCLVNTIQRSSDFYARFGGEEFVVILYGTELNDAHKIINQLQQSFSDLAIPHEKSDVSNVVTFSAGVCSAQPFEDQLNGFLERTDSLLYQAKEQGRARVISKQYTNLLNNKSST